MKIDARVLIHPGGRKQVQLVRGNDAVMLIADVECGRRQNIVMNLLRRAAVFEDQRDRILTGRCRAATCNLRPGLIGSELLLLA